jgi:hypothetical protein
MQENDKLAQEIIQRYQKMIDNRRVFDSHWQELATYIMPRKSNIVVRRSQGAKQTERLFDSTAIDANAKLAAFIQGGLTNPVIPWFNLKLRNPALQEVQPILQWLEECSDSMFHAFADSNFNSEVQEVYLDLGCFGTAALSLEERDLKSSGFNGFRFQALPIGQYAIAENPDGEVDTLFRDFQWSVKTVLQKWGMTKVSDQTRSKYEKNPEDKITIIHAVYPNISLGPDSFEKPFISIYLEADTKHVLNKSGYDEFPFMVPRWSKTSGEVYGRGPGMTALPDIKTLNRAKEMDLKGWAKEIDPPLMVLDEGVVGGKIDLRPGARNTVLQKDAIVPIQSGARHDVTQIKAQELMTSIRQMFFNDQFQLPDKTMITATEVQNRLDLMLRILGPTVGRLESEFLAPMVNRAFALMFRAGALPEPPSEFMELLQAQQGDVDIEYDGPISRAQRGNELAATQRFYGTIAPIAHTDPTALDNINTDEVVRMTAMQSGVPARFLRDPKQVQQLRQARAQQQAAMQKAAEMNQAADSVGKMSNVLSASQQNQLGLLESSPDESQQTA